MSEYIIRMDGVHQQYPAPNKGEAHVVLNDINLKIKRGELVTLVGPTGCGKSTLLRLILGSELPFAGQALINGSPILQPDRDRGIVFQRYSLFENRTVLHNVMLGLELEEFGLFESIFLTPGYRARRREFREKAEHYLSRVGLLQHADKYPHQLSGGMRQRAAIAQAMVMKPAVLLMDEPFGAVDPLGRLLLQNEFLAIQKRLKKTVVFVTHDLDEAIRLADRIAIMNDGKIVQYDIPETILSSPVNSFVRDFVGSDRSLKKLARYDAARAMKEPEAVILDDESSNERLAVLAQRGLRFVWAIGADRRLKGWIDLRHPFISSAPLSGFTEISVPEVAVGPEVSLKSVLSRMLGQGIKSIPVIDRDEKLIGEITLRDIERVSES